MIFEVIKEHQSSQQEPIQLKIGDRVSFSDRLSGPEGWERWIYCYIEETNLEGWVPEQIIYKYKENQGVLMRDYVAKELNVKVGDKFQLIEELNGWIRGRLISSSEEGWLPKDHIEPSRE
ncbi:ligand-binding protein SH3 [Pontibacillus yanchengensis]|uniref:Ligand-binding protein SH3 n=2 Tax=Pontibacillus yanchengensis TaxID=462910 RepID=A0ACC7VMJ3_9BACI|nr:SH3 domain-containing protein [Pontibacillus yanchengensis]MYL33783.1 ligand-binding protein SH3 [Pontibacillus yanchengensis]MYL55759.1 ligand-binding protein SH3 [Pontibacillus yanchengensis]